MSVRFFAPVPTARVAAETPPDRDRVVDAARGLSLLIVVAGHALMALVAWPGGVPRVGNLLAAFPWTQVLTWALQISPLFFFAGGAANTISWDRHLARGGSYAPWIWARTERLLRPVWAYLLIAGCIAGVVSAFAPKTITDPLMLLATQLLWFLGSYILVTALTPLFQKATPLRGALTTFAVIATCGLTDVLRLFAHWSNAIGLINFVLVWTIPAYLGSLRARGTLARYSTPFLTGVLVADLFINALLVKFGPWPISFIGVPGERISNMAPPTLVLAIHSVTLVAGITLLNGPLTRVLARPKVWRRIAGVNLVAMTLYLWHLPVLVALFALSHYLGLDRPTRIGANGHPVPNGWGYAVGSIAFWAVFAICVWMVVRLLWPLEHAPLPWWDSTPRTNAPSERTASIFVAIGVCGAGITLLMLSATGLGGFPTRIIHYSGVPLNSAAAIALLVGSGALIRWAGATRL